MSAIALDSPAAKLARVSAPLLPEPELNLIGGFGYEIKGRVPLDLTDNPNCQKAISRRLYEEIAGGILSLPRYSEPESFPKSSELEPIRSVVLHDLAQLGNDYHNHEHTVQVGQCFRILAKYSTLLESGEERLSAPIVQALQQERLNLGDTISLIHDNEHAGMRYRQRLPLAVGLRGKMSNEEWASWTGDGLITNLYSPRQRLIIQAGVLATSFAQSEMVLSEAKDKDLLKRPYAPTTKLEKLICFADISSFLLGTDRHLKSSLNLLSEIGQKPESFEKWKAAEKDFLKFIRSRFNDLVKDGVLDKAGALEIGNRVSRFEAEYSTLLNDHNTRRRYDLLVARLM